MLRNKAFAALQKAYDDSYLSCSTAVYYEGQGDEIEATRHWRHALQQIYEHRATKTLSGYGAQTDTEKALVEALKQLELQCKERIDLLEALRMSREEGLPSSLDKKNIRKSSELDSRHDANDAKGSIGRGTIPAVSYSQLSRPTLLKRPSLPARPFSGPAASAVSGGKTNDDETRVINSASSQSQVLNQSTPHDESARSSSPEKYTMRTTLRSGKTNDKFGKMTRRSPKPAAEGPSKAATLAWSALGSHDRSWKTPSPDGSSSSPSLSTRHSSDQTRAVTSSLQWDSHSRRLVTARASNDGANGHKTVPRQNEDGHLLPKTPQLSLTAAYSALNLGSSHDASEQLPDRSEQALSSRRAAGFASSLKLHREKQEPTTLRTDHEKGSPAPEQKNASGSLIRREAVPKRAGQSPLPVSKAGNSSHVSTVAQRSQNNAPFREKTSSESVRQLRDSKRRTTKSGRRAVEAGDRNTSSEDPSEEDCPIDDEWKLKKAYILRNLPPGVDENAAKQILNDIVIQGDEVHWGDIAGLEIAKNALRETVVYPFLRPDLFMGLREPARGMLLFGPPGTGKTMLARAVATESKSTFFSISASSLTSKYLGESEKLVRALFALARSLAPSIIFVDEIDSLLSQRSGSGEHEATRRIKTEFLIQWSDLQRAAAGREATDREKERGDANRVLVLAATNLPWAIDEAARRRFVRRQYIPLPEPHTRATQLRTLLGQQKHGLSALDIEKLVKLTDGFSGSDMTALAKDAAMGPLRSLGEALLHMTMDDIRPMQLQDFEASLGTIRPSVSKAGLREYEDWAREFGERGG